MNGGTKFTIFNLLLFVFISCSNLGNDQNSIVGTWYCINYPTDICYRFTNDRVTIEFGDNFSLQGEYKIISHHDSIVFNVDSGFGSIYCHFHFVDQFLVLTAYKELEEYPNHIDEVLLLSKSNKKLIDNKELEVSQLENHVFFF